MRANSLPAHQAILAERCLPIGVSDDVHARSRRQQHLKCGSVNVASSDVERSRATLEGHAGVRPSVDEQAQTASDSFVLPG